MCQFKKQIYKENIEIRTFIPKLIQILTAPREPTGFNYFLRLENMM